MKSALIHSGSPWKRNAPAAFLLSLFFPGLGQVYNGELGRGTAFQGGIALLVFTIPFYAARFPARNHLIFFAATMLSSLLLWLSSPIEAFVYARRGPAATQKRYNTVPAYLAYAASSLVITALLSFVTVAFFSLEKITDDRMAPALRAGERVLVDRYSAKEPSAGDIVIYLHFGTQSPGRVLATGGSVIRFVNRVITVNDVPLSHGVYSDAEARKAGFDNTELLYYEANGGRKYPILFSNDTPAPLSGNAALRVGPGEILVASDNRAAGAEFHVIKASDITGRVEGILVSRAIRRLFAIPHSRL